MKIISINKDQIPLQVLIVIEGEQYKFVFDYNASFDFFSVSLLKDNITLVSSEKVVLGRPLFTTISNPFKETYLIPLDLSNEASNITFENFGDTVFIWFFTIKDGVVTSV